MISLDSILVEGLYIYVFFHQFSYPMVYLIVSYIEVVSMKVFIIKQPNMKSRIIKHK